jgi:hypothetical protein
MWSNGGLSRTKGKDDGTKKYNGRFIGADHSSEYVFIHHHVSLQAGDTLLCKHRLEREAANYRVQIKRYHVDNRIFANDVNVFCIGVAAIGSYIVSISVN